MRGAFPGPPKTAACRHRTRRFLGEFLGEFALWLLLLVPPAYGHVAGVSSSEISVNGRNVAVEINALARDYEKAAGVRISEAGSGVVNAVALSVMAPALLGYVRSHVQVLSGEVPCEPDEGMARPADTHVTVTLVWSCPDSGALRYRLSLFRDVDPSAQHLVSLETEGDKREFALDKNTPELALSGGVPSNFQVARHFLAAGIEHIFLGYDHVAFLIAIILWTSRLWPVVKAVTAFTVAHSITLSLAALDVVRIPSAIIEPAIAASIIYVAVENFTTREAGNRWREAFTFGLLHGFGFASALEELGLPRAKLITALAAFNFGVEIGQVLIVATAFGLLSAVDRWQVSGATGPVRSPALVHVVSFAIILLGSYWFVSRTLAS
jgi:hydrogenase/urease accessory protein HupE